MAQMVAIPETAKPSRVSNARPPSRNAGNAPAP
jgi:hypothetical protein